jgi:hypothetical protein
LRIPHRCLAKKQGERPQSAEELDAALAECACAGAWDAKDAERWWKEHA